MRLTIALALSLLVSACGFHLRGDSGVAFPEALSRLRVVVEDSRLVNDPLLLIVRNMLQADGNVKLTDEPDTPVLTLFGEHVDIQVVSVNLSGRASGYRMKYEVSYRVLDAKGKEMIPPQGVRSLRDYTFDPVNVLAKEREEQDLKRNMQREAIQQIFRRLSRYNPPETPVDANRP
jgi:LPS-assembly lipoprotein